MVSDAFVGESRRALVDGLAGMFEEVRDSRRPCWVSLEAPPGWGKTRVGRELFARLAAAQRDEAPYWPAAIEDSDRKKVDPGDFERPAFALPEHLWWGISSSRRRERGRPSALLEDDLWLLSRHGTYMEEQVKKLGSEPTRVRRVAQTLDARRVAGTLVREGAAEVAAWGVEQAVAAVGAAVPGVGALVGLARWGGRKTAESRDLRRDIASPTLFSDSDVREPDIVDQTVELLGRVTREGFPVAVLVEDVHDADELLLELLDKLLGSGGALLLVTTAWPERVGVGEGEFSLPALMESHVGLLRRVGHTEPAGEGFPQGAGLTMLEADTRRDILRGFFPDMEAATEQALAERYQSPLALRLFCEWFSKKMRPEDRNADGALELCEQDVSKLPVEVRGLYQEIWQQLPREAQISLAVARLITPASISDSEAGQAGREDVWTAWVLRDVLSSLPYDRFADVPVENMRGALESGSGAHSWVRIMDEHLRSFTEALQRDIAEEDGRGVLAHSLGLDGDHVRAQILTHLASALVSETEFAANSNMARCMLALHAEGYITDITVAAQATLTLLTDLANKPRELRERLRLYEQFRNLDSTICDATTWAIHHYAAAVYNELGQHPAAVVIYQRLLNDIQQVGDVDVESLIFFDVRGRLAASLGAAGRKMESVAAFVSLVADMRRVLGEDHRDTLAIRSNLAMQLGAAGREAESVAAFVSLVADMRRVLGEDHHDTLVTRSNLVNLLGGASGREAEAVIALEELLVDYQRVLGDDHRRTLLVRNNLAIFLSKSGREAEAVAMYEKLLVDQRRVLGDDHPHTLATLNYVAFGLKDIGRVHEAVTAFEALVAAWRRVLGDDHRDTFHCRGDLALSLWQSGRKPEAVAALEELLADYQRVFGDDDPDQTALKFRNNLAVFHWQSGREAEAVAALEELLADWQPVLGDSHHEIFKARNNLSAFLSETGQVAGTVIMSPQGAGGSVRSRRASAASPGTVIKSAKEKLGRNDPCHCGSGRKFKHCCGR